MSDYESVNKIKSLQQYIETFTGKSYSDLTSAVQALKNGYGGTGGGSGIVDVTELPTSNIDENAVYRVTENVQVEENQVYITDTNQVATIQQYFASSGIPTVPNIYVVDEPTSDMKTSDVQTFSEVHIYISRNDGIAYLNAPALGGIVTVGLIGYQAMGYDKGFTENIHAETEEGIYTTLEAYKTVVRWFVRENGEWKEVTAHIDSDTPHGHTDIEFLYGSYTKSDQIELTGNGDTLNIVDIITETKTIPSSVFVNVEVPDVSAYITRQLNDVPESHFVDKYGYGVDRIGEYSFAGNRSLKNVSIPKTVHTIGHHAFHGCENLALTSLPDGITNIAYNAFYGCENLALTSLPSSVKKIDSYAFQNCTGLTSMTLRSKCINSFANIFDGCTNLTTINVPWSEGEVSGAPWGATNATINYNYTGE